MSVVGVGAVLTIELSRQVCLYVQRSQLQTRIVEFLAWLQSRISSVHHNTTEFDVVVLDPEIIPDELPNLANVVDDCIRSRLSRIQQFDANVVQDMFNFLTMQTMPVDIKDCVQALMPQSWIHDESMVMFLYKEQHRIRRVNELVAEIVQLYLDSCEDCMTVEFKNCAKFESWMLTAHIPHLQSRLHSVVRGYLTAVVQLEVRFSEVLWQDDLQEDGEHTRYHVEEDLGIDMWMNFKHYENLGGKLPLLAAAVQAGTLQPDVGEELVIREKGRRRLQRPLSSICECRDRDDVQHGGKIPHIRDSLPYEHTGNCRVLLRPLWLSTSTCSSPEAIRLYEPFPKWYVRYMEGRRQQSRVLELLGANRPVA